MPSPLLRARNWRARAADSVATGGGVCSSGVISSRRRRAQRPITRLAEQAAAPALQPSAEQAAAGARPFTPATAPGAVVAAPTAAAPVQLPSWVARPDIPVGQPSVLAGVQAPEALRAQYRVAPVEAMRADGYTALQAQLLRAYNPRRFGSAEPVSPLGQYGMNPDEPPQQQGGSPYGY